MSVPYDFISKVESRADVLLPLDRPSHQYWTLCADHVDEEWQKLLLGSELEHLLSEGFLTTDQFYGVDYDAEIIERNQAVIPEAHWFYGDFRDVLARAHTEGWLDPSIVNVDLTWGPEKSIEYARRILCLLRPYEDVTVVLNFAQEFRSHRETLDDLHEMIAKELWIELKHWNLAPESYTYQGRGSLTRMRTFIFSR